MRPSHTLRFWFAARLLLACAACVLSWQAARADRDELGGCKRAGKHCERDAQCCLGLGCDDDHTCNPGCRVLGVFFSECDLSQGTEEEAELFSHVTSHVSPSANTVQLDPGATRSFTVRFAQPSAVMATADSFGSGGPLELSVWNGRTSLATGTGVLVDSNRASVSVVAQVPEPMTITVRVRNRGSASVSVVVAIDSLH